MFWNKLVSGLSKTRKKMTEGLEGAFERKKIDEDFFDEIEEILVMADIGVETSMKIVENFRNEIEKEKIKSPALSKDVLIQVIKDEMVVSDGIYDFEEEKSVILIIGVNGAGKTTTIGKLAMQYKQRGKKVLLAAADTFRAAASEQLKMWANRANTPIISGQEGSDPASVLFDAISSAKAKDVDILICDTAGRLHNKKNLMNELHKLKQVVSKEYEQAKLEIILVLDGTTGQNALVQAKQFLETVDNIDGIIITKLDGTAKGGMAIAIWSQLNIPIKYIGVGEGIKDLQKFDKDSFVDALFVNENEKNLEDEE